MSITNPSNTTSWISLSWRQRLLYMMKIRLGLKRSSFGPLFLRKNLIRLEMDIILQDTSWISKSTWSHYYCNVSAKSKLKAKTRKTTSGEWPSVQGAASKKSPLLSRMRLWSLSLRSRVKIYNPKIGKNDTQVSSLSVLLSRDLIEMLSRKWLCRVFRV